MFVALFAFAVVCGILLPLAVYIFITYNEKKGKGSRLQKNVKRVIAVELCLALTAAFITLGINGYVKHVGGKNIITAEEACALEDVDCILVLGCLVYSNGRPSDALNDRLTVGVDLYKNKAAPKLLMSGDHGQHTYNEVKVMKEWAVDAGVPDTDIFMDHAGFSTYESIYRAKEVFLAKKIIIVTQEYHLYRALYIADRLGIEAYGVNSDLHRFVREADHNAREVLARVNDFLTTIFKPKPTYLGDTIPINGNGNVTND